MGFFNKKKDENDTVEVQQLQENIEAVNPTDASAPRMFNMVVENVTTMLDGDGVIVLGELQGHIIKGDMVYIYVPGIAPIESTVLAIETQVDGHMTIKDEAEDAFSSIQLELKDAKLIKKYAVVSSQKQIEELKPGVAVDNPALAGIICGMPKFGKDNAFHAVVSYWLSHSYLITPVKVDSDSDGKKNLGFYMLKSSAHLAGTAEGKDSLVLPLFTDGVSLRRWAALSKDGAPTKTQIIRFPDLIAFLRKGKDAYSGIALNPFNKVPCTLPMPYLETITNTTGYKRDFGEATEASTNADAVNANGKKEVKILLGVPKDTEETREIRDMLEAYGEDEDDIKSINLMVKIEEATKNVRYLVLLEMDVDKNTAKAHMDSLYQQLKPLTKEIKQIEYAIKGRIPEIDKIAEQNKDKMLVYQQA